MIRRLFIALLLAGGVALLLLPAPCYEPVERTVLEALHWLGKAGQSLGDACQSEEEVQPVSEAAEREYEDVQLRITLLELQRKVQDLEALLRHIDNLHAIDEAFQQTFRICPARIRLYRDASSWHDTVVIDRGAHHGVQVGAPVVHDRYVIGVVMQVSDSTSRLRLTSDAEFRARAYAVEPPGKTPYLSRSITGLLRGTGRELLSLDWITPESPMHEGWWVVSAEGPEGLWPEGLLFGKVVYSSTEDLGSQYKVLVELPLYVRDIVHVLVLLPAES